MRKIFLPILAASLLPLSLVNAESPRMCTLEYNPVCGIDPKTKEPQLYGNACARDVAGAKPCDKMESEKEKCKISAGHMYSEMLEKCVNPREAETVFELAKKMGLTTVENLEQFRADSTISREEVAGIMQRAFEKNLFPARPMTLMMYVPEDAAEISAEFAPAINFVYNAGIMRGDNGKFSPKNSLTHLEAMIVILRSVDNEADYAVKTHPWYAEYLKAFNDKMVTEKSEEFLNSSISRKDFFTWVMRFAEEDSSKSENNFVLNGAWKLETFQPKGAMAEKISATAEFTDEKIFAKFCNNISGEIAYSNGVFSTKGLASTRMLCGDEKLMNAEMAFQLDGAKFALENENSRLIITTNEGNIFTFVK